MLLSKLFIILTSLILSQTVVEQDTTTFIHPLKIPIVFFVNFWVYGIDLYRTPLFGALEREIRT